MTFPERLILAYVLLYVVSFFGMLSSAEMGKLSIAPRHFWPRDKGGVLTGVAALCLVVALAGTGLLWLAGLLW